MLTNRTVRGPNREYFKELCKKWILAVRDNLSYEDYKSIELEIISLCPNFNLDPDEVFAALSSNAKNYDDIDSIY